MRQISINQTSISDPIRFPKDPLVSIDRRAKGIMKFIYSESKDRLLLSFSDYSGKSVAQRIFNDMPAFKIYLSTREDVNTWEVRIKAKDDSLQSKLAYFHREPFGDIEQFGFERDLNRILSLEGGGRWITEYAGCSATDLKRVGMIDQSTWRQTIFTTFNTETSFQKANQTHEQEYASWRRTLGWGLLGLLVGGMITPFLNRNSSQRDHEEAKVESTEDESFFDSESPDEYFSPTPEFISQETTLLASSMIQKVGIMALSWQLSSQRGVSASVTLGLLNTFMEWVPGSLAKNINSADSTFLETLFVQGPGFVSELGSTVDFSIFPDSKFLAVSSVSSAGDKSNITLVKLSNNGTLLGVRKIQSRNDSFNVGDTVRTSDGNLVMVAGSDNSSQGPNTGYVLKSNYEGKLLWAYALNGNFDFDGTTVVAETPDNSIVIAATPYSSPQIMLAKFSKNGTLQWAFKGIVPQFCTDAVPYISSIAPSINGSIVITGSIVSYIDGYVEKLLVGKFANNGTQLWFNTIGQTNYDGGSGIAVTSDGSIFITGSTYPKSYGRALLLAKWDSDGSLVWSKILSGNDSPTFSGDAITVLANGDLLTGGSTANNGPSQPLLLRWSNNGTLIWDKVIGGDSVNFISFAAQNDNFLIGGVGSEGVLVVSKLDTTGAISSCKYVQPSNGNSRFIKMNSTSLSFVMKPVKFTLRNILENIHYGIGSAEKKQYCPSEATTTLARSQKLSNVAKSRYLFFREARKRDTQSDNLVIEKAKQPDSRSKMLTYG